MRAFGSVLFAVATALLLPAVAFGQGSIAGIVRDTSGAILPGVTVEAASPALIEKVRAATTDASGRYQVVSLTPGTYSVTFSLPGFNTVRREGIEISGTFAASVDIDMRVGTVEETITVTGESPIVDVQNTDAAARDRLRDDRPDPDRTKRRAARRDDSGRHRQRRLRRRRVRAARASARSRAFRR